MNEDNWLEMAYEDRTEIYDFSEVMDWIYDFSEVMDCDDEGELDD